MRYLARRITSPGFLAAQARLLYTGQARFVDLGGLRALVFLSAAGSGQNLAQLSSINVATITLLALGSALVLVPTAQTGPRILGLAAVTALALATLNTAGFSCCTGQDIVPTLVHVYLFTAFFIIYRALEAAIAVIWRSASSCYARSLAGSSIPDDIRRAHTS